MNRLYDLLDYSIFMKNKKQIRDRLLENQYLIEKKIAILCGSTVGEIKEFLTIFLLMYGIKPIFWEGNYNRFYEEACFDNSELSAFAPDFVILHITGRNLLYLDRFSMKNNKNILIEEKNRLIQIWTSLEKKYHCSIIQNNFEYFSYRIIGNWARIGENGNIKYIDDLNSFVSSYAREHSNFYVNDINYLSAYVGLKNWYDNRMWNLYKCPMSMSSMPYYSLSIVNIIKSILGKNKKAVITDLDNTLWGGTIGEIGVDAICLGKETPQGESYSELHKYLKVLTQNGIILNVCSKNEYETGISGLNSPQSLLKEADFSVKNINWNNKVDNIKDILSQINLLSDSAIYLDDSEIECDSIKTMIPEVETLQVKNIYKLLDKIDIVSYFEVTGVTSEDKKRQMLYKDEELRNRERQQFTCYEDYLKSLNMKYKVYAIDKTNIQRVVQLFNKTNQFNFMTNRYTIPELTYLCEQLGTETFVLALKDKFGDNGIVSVAIVKFEGNKGHINDWIMSCRVFERGLEYEMLKQICSRCIKKDVIVLYGYYHETAKNKKISDFYKNLDFSKDVDNDRWVCEDIGHLMHLIETKSAIFEEEK